MNIRPMTVRFLHLRRCLPLLVKLDTDLIVFSGVSPYGGVTVAYRDMGDGDYQVALGRCRNDERYERKLGRAASVFNLIDHGAIIHIGETDVQQKIVAYAHKVARRNLRPILKASYTKLRNK